MHTPSDLMSRNIPKYTCTSERSRPGNSSSSCSASLIAKTLACRSQQSYICQHFGQILTSHCCRHGFRPSSAPLLHPFSKKSEAKDTGISTSHKNSSSIQFLQKKTQRKGRVSRFTLDLNTFLCSHYTLSKR